MDTNIMVFLLSSETSSGAPQYCHRGTVHGISTEPKSTSWLSYMCIAAVSDLLRKYRNSQNNTTNRGADSSFGVHFVAKVSRNKCFSLSSSTPTYRYSCNVKTIFMHAHTSNSDTHVTDKRTGLCKTTVSSN